MTNYQAIKDELEKKQNNLDKANKKSLELDNNSKDIKIVINNLKQSKVNKENFILDSDDKTKIIEYINQLYSYFLK